MTVHPRRHRPVDEGRTGTEGGGSKTIIGDNCTFLAYSHVAHDCILGNNIILSNNVMLAGHCVLEDNVIFGGGSGIHQFSRVGRNAFIGGMTGVEGDVIPFGIMGGDRGQLIGLNVIGMKRAGFERKSILAATGAFKRIFSGDAPLREKADQIGKNTDDPLVMQIVNFINAARDRKICQPKTPKK
jgi:UDP-N-acetylglucosamine acyltransferase